MNNIVLAQYYANKVCKSCASLAGFFACCLADVIRFCCNLQPCVLHVASCIAVVIGVLLPAMCHNLRHAGRAPPATARLQHLPVAALTQAVKSDIGSESRFLPTPPAFDAPVRGVPVGVLPSRLVLWLSDGEKNEYIFIRFDTMHESDRHTHTQTHTYTHRKVPHDEIGRAYA